MVKILKGFDSQCALITNIEDTDDNMDDDDDGVVVVEEGVVNNEGSG